MQFLLTAAESWDFARLSGDFNPLHVDPIAARRLQFGGTICHGIHQLLKALDLTVESGALLPERIESLSAVFSASLPTDVLADVRFSSDDDASRARVTVSALGRTLFTVRLTVADDLLPCERPISGELESPSAPTCLIFPKPGEASALAGSVPVRLNAPLARRLFPTLAAHALGASWTADLIATTRIVGMECPGLHSIYSELKLRRRTAAHSGASDDSDAPPASMPYAVQHCDPRFRSVRIGVSGAILQGTLNAFFRSPPVSQVRLDELLARVPADRFSGQHALVVGGSRGLGEMVAKILVAGGAQVTLTYATGQSDAEHIQQAARDTGRDIRIMKLDASVPLTSTVEADLTVAGITHLYHFATPQIAKSPDGQWSAALFGNFSRLYLHAFAELVQAIAPKDAGSPVLTALYPSTVFLDTPPKGFAEYCAAKAAGEVLCQHLAKSLRVQITCPRFPRLQTDQNNSFLGAAGEAPLPILLELLQTLHPAATEPVQTPQGLG
jgi:NAD(P)-dependent dehydrogenase (short-subunit alcohol dehydrogenase family)